MRTIAVVYKSWLFAKSNAAAGQQPTLKLPIEANKRKSVDFQALFIDVLARTDNLFLWCYAALSV